MSNCPRRTIGWSSCPVIRSQRRICCSCFDSCRSNFLLNRRRESKPGTIEKSRERSSPVVPTFGAASLGFQYLGVTHPPQLVKSGYLAFVGRISPEKGPVDAIRIAQSLGIPLKIAAKVDKLDESYFREVVQPMLSTQGVEFIGEINEKDKGPFLRDASALLFSICWPEPFGLVMIEAMACGTPVLAYRAGAVPEVIDEGVTGMIVDNIDQARIASVRVAALDRRKVRRRFEERFTARRMAKDYVRVYQSLAYHAAQPGRGTKYPVNGGARISGDELVSAADKHAD